MDDHVANYSPNYDSHKSNTASTNFAFGCCRSYSSCSRSTQMAAKKSSSCTIVAELASVKQPAAARNRRHRNYPSKRSNSEIARGTKSTIYFQYMAHSCSLSTTAGNSAPALLRMTPTSACSASSSVKSK